MRVLIAGVVIALAGCNTMPTKVIERNLAPISEPSIEMSTGWEVVEAPQRPNAVYHMAFDRDNTVLTDDMATLIEFAARQPTRSTRYVIVANGPRRVARSRIQVIRQEMTNRGIGRMAIKGELGKGDTRIEVYNAKTAPRETS